MKPVPAAYADTNALAIGCPRCAADVNSWCTKTDGRVSRVPCVDRIAAASVVVESGPRYRDFSEPTHQPRKDSRTMTTDATAGKMVAKLRLV